MKSTFFKLKLGVAITMLVLTSATQLISRIRPLNFNEINRTLSIDPNIDRSIEILDYILKSIDPETLTMPSEFWNEMGSNFVVNLSIIVPGFSNITTPPLTLKINGDTINGNNPIPISLEMPTAHMSDEESQRESIELAVKRSIADRSLIIRHMQVIEYIGEPWTGVYNDEFGTCRNLKIYNYGFWDPIENRPRFDNFRFMERTEIRTENGGFDILQSYSESYRYDFAIGAMVLEETIGPRNYEEVNCEMETELL